MGIALAMSVKAAITIRRPQAEVESSWRELGSEIAESGSVRFTPAPGDQGTEIHVEVEQGRLDRLKGIFGDEPAMDVKDELRRFKQIVETGEVVRSDGSPDGQALGRLARQRPAQPLGESEHADLVGSSS
jgi:uncharacterized membrane protein